MLISCNRLKSYIKDSSDIDFLKVWDIFTLKTAEVENVVLKGNDMKDVVTAKIISCERHPDSEKLSLLKVSDGIKEYNIVCGAPNVRVGLIGALVKDGGMVSGYPIKTRKLAGYVSEGMMCAMDELGIGTDHDGILELPSDTPLGVDFTELFPVKDIIVEIDNKSLTNRPDLWGHYGIAREIAAITNHELLPLELENTLNDKEDLDIKIEEPNLCKRYCGIKIDDLDNNKTPLDMQIFLHYTGMRSINLFVDLTNYLMLELGQPMHAFDARVVKNINVKLANEGDTYTTLDGVERTLSSDTLMITNGEKYFGIAGIMGGLDSEILPDTKSIFLESANFLAGSIRKTAVRLGLRTESSARYEKSLDPNMCDIAIKRLMYLLRKENPSMVVASNLTEIYKEKLEEKEVILKKEKLHRYTAINISDEEVKKTLESLGFKVEITSDAYVITVPTFRATKDITMDADIIEEIVRMYGYDRVVEMPLNVNTSASVLENIWDLEYKVKYYLATKWNMHEVHSYIWYDTDSLKEIGIVKENVRLLANNKNNILRDDLSLSLLPIVKNNLKNRENLKIFEIGTAIVKNQNNRQLSIILCDDADKLKDMYYEAKLIVSDLFKALKNTDISFKATTSDNYYVEDKILGIYEANTCFGAIKIFNGGASKYVGKKKCVVTVLIDFLEFAKLAKKEVLFKEVSKYPTVSLDYTLLATKDKKYADILSILEEFKSKLIKELQFVDVYEDNDKKKYTVRYIVGSNNRTLESEELEKFKERFIGFVKEKGLDIIV